MINMNPATIIPIVATASALVIACVITYVSYDRYYRVGRKAGLKAAKRHGSAVVGEMKGLAASEKLQGAKELLLKSFPPRQLIALEEKITALKESISSVEKEREERIERAKEEARHDAKIVTANDEAILHAEQELVRLKDQVRTLDAVYKAALEKNFEASDSSQRSNVIDNHVDGVQNEGVATETIQRLGKSIGAKMTEFHSLLRPIPLLLVAILLIVSDAYIFSKQVTASWQLAGTGGDTSKAFVVTLALSLFLFVYAEKIIDGLNAGTIGSRVAKMFALIAITALTVAALICLSLASLRPGTGLLDLGLRFLMIPLAVAAALMMREWKHADGPARTTNLIALPLEIIAYKILVMRAAGKNRAKAALAQKRQDAEATSQKTQEDGRRARVAEIERSIDTLNSKIEAKTREISTMRGTRDALRDGKIPVTQQPNLTVEINKIEESVKIRIGLFAAKISRLSESVHMLKAGFSDGVRDAIKL